MANPFHGLLSGLGKVGGAIGRGGLNYIDGNAIGGLLGQGVDPSEIDPRMKNQMRGAWLGNIGAALQSEAPFQAGQNAYQQQMLGVLDQMKQKKVLQQQAQEKAAFQQRVDKMSSAPVDQRAAELPGLIAYATSRGYDKEADNLTNLYKEIKPPEDKLSNQTFEMKYPTGNPNGEMKSGLFTLKNGKPIFVGEPKDPELMNTGGTGLYDPLKKTWITPPAIDKGPIEVSPGASLYDPKRQEAVYTAPGNAPQANTPFAASLAAWRAANPGKEPTTQEIAQLQRGLQPPQQATQAQLDKQEKKAMLGQVMGGIRDLSERINTQAGIVATISGAAEKAKAKINLDDDVAEYESLIQGYTPIVARAVGHTGVLTQQDVDSVRQMFPQTRDSKSLRDRKIARLEDIIGGVVKPAAPQLAAPKIQWPGAPPIGSKFDGREYLGGNPNSKESWK